MATPVDQLAALLRDHRRWFVLTGAGVSTQSGIPDYRDDNGDWKRPQPVRYADFMRSPEVRRRYWARSMVGWPKFRIAHVGAAHRALADLEHAGSVDLLLTQNVDRLHQQAGSERVVDLHGRLDEVACQQCQQRTPRDAFQRELTLANPAYAALDAGQAPDGDADLTDVDLDGFRVPDCAACGGLLKPDVVFFGERVPPERVDLAFEKLDAAEAMLVVGSSLMVWSGFRFARHAAQAGKPLVIINRGRTRADELATLKWEADCGDALSQLIDVAQIERTG